MEARTIVAIEIASSKVKGAVAVVAPDGSMNVPAVEEQPTLDSVRHGRVQNVREVSAAVNEVIRKLENNPAVAPRKVQTVVVALGGRSLTGTPASATLNFPREIEVNEETIRRLKSEAAKDFVANKNIEATLPRTFYVNNVQVKPVVGTVASSLRGDFIMLTCSRENRQNLERLKFDSIRAGNVFYQLRPTAVADLVLDDDEKQLGCVLVDFGAETTTVSIYKNGTLAFLTTIPMGSRLITMDLMAGLTLTEAAAEEFKITLGSAGEQRGSGTNSEEVNNYVRARAGEIAANIVNQIELSGIPADTLGAGIVLVGGGAKLPEFGALLAAQSRMSLRRGTMPADITLPAGRPHPDDDIDVVSLLAAARPFTDIEGLTPEPSDPVHEEPEPEPEAAVAPATVIHDDEPAHTGIHEAAPAHGRTRYVPDEDDETLLQDDEDYDDVPVRETAGGGFFGFGRKKNVPVEEYDKSDAGEEDSYDETYEEDDEDDTVQENSGGSMNKVTSIVDRLRNSIERFFGTPTEEDDEEDN